MNMSLGFCFRTCTDSEQTSGKSEYRVRRGGAEIEIAIFVDAVKKEEFTLTSYL